jgi:hypothetical protein
VTRECDHCDEAVANLMSLIDHEFSGTEVRGMNVHVRRLLAAEREKVLAEFVAWLAKDDSSLVEIADVLEFIHTLRTRKP